MGSELGKPKKGVGAVEYHKKISANALASKHHAARLKKAPKLTREEELQAIESYIQTHGVTKCPLSELSRSLVEGDNNE